MKLLMLLATTSLVLGGTRREKRQVNYYGGGGNYPNYPQGQGRANVQGCTLNPPDIKNKETPAKAGQMIDITCNSNSEYNSCFFVHTKPFDVNQHSSHDTDLECATSGDGNSMTKQCADDPRIAITSSMNSCGLRISNPEPDDTGVWKVVLSEYVNDRMVTNEDTFTIYTYNKSVSVLQDEDENEINQNYDVNYNYDDWRDRWVDGEGAYESHTLSCYSRYGRPEPEFTWYIDRTDLSLSANNQFRITDQTGSTHDPSGYVKDRYSEIQFEVNSDFLNYLEDNHNINVNPENGQFSFDLTCEAKQGSNGEYYTEEISTRINVNRVFHPDRLTNNQIGMIVGIVLGVLVLFIVGAVLLLIFAKSTERWCFANDDYQYRDPQDKRRPVSHAQVHRFIKTNDDDSHNKPPPSNTNHYSKQSSGSKRSSHSSTERKVHPDDWIPSSKDTEHNNFKQSTDPKIINYELQVKSSNSDSGLSSPSSSIDKAKIVPTPLSSAKPRQRPKSQQITKSNQDIAKRLSTYTSYNNIQVENNPQVYKVDQITYADLDPRAFMVPHNKVLPTDNSGRKTDSGSDSKSTYAEISSKPMYV